jgi:hypothetical protein
MVVANRLCVMKDGRLHFDLDKCHLFDGSFERWLATGLAAIDQN